VTRRAERIANALTMVWFILTMLALTGAWFGLIPTP
jgi:hypothetical protein